MATGMTYLAKRDLRRSGIKVTLRRALAVTTCVAMSLIGGAAMSHAATVGTLYVDRTMSTCSDNGSGTVTAPFCTITKGVSKLTPGSTLYVGNGAYGESIKPTVSGTSSAGLLITAWPGRSPVIGAGVADGVYVSGRSYITISDLTFTGTTGDGIYVSNSDHITIAGNTVTFSGQPAKSLTAHGISLRASTASLVTGNTSDQNSDHGILLTSGTTSSTVSYNETSWNANGWQRNANGIDVISAGNTIIGNIAHDNEDSGLQFYPGGDNNLATLNVLYNNGDHGIDDFSVTGGRLIGNTVFHNCTTGINVEGTSGSYLVANNIAVDNAVYPAYRGISCSRRNGNIGIWDSAPSSTTVDHNLVWLTKPGAMYVFGSSYTSLSSMQAATGQERAGVQADPKFVSTSTGDFRLTEGSPAIDRADSGVPGEQSADILGNPRVRDLNVTNTFAAGPRQYDDLGAYEFQPITAPPPAQPPTAALSATPTGGQAPTVVTANASASTDPQGQTLSYAYDFGDGTTIAAQPGATATHTYQSAGTFTVTLTVTNTSALTSSAHTTVTITSPPPPINPAYVGQIATNYSTSAKTSAYITVWRSAGVQAGDLVVLTLQLSGTASTGPVTATDDRGSTYTVASSVANATGGRLVVLSGIALQPLAVGARLTATFPTATGERIIGDEFAGVSHVDTTAAASGTATAFSSGVTATTSTARELVFGSVAMFGGSANPIWATGWKDMTTYVVAPNYLGRAYQLPTATGGFAATGSASGSWLAVSVAFAP
jgi:parallel beta-helix repeat protein